MFKNYKTLILLIFMAFILAACGGGGSGSDSTEKDDSGSDKPPVISSETSPLDVDEDLIFDSDDNCPNVANSGQEDTDADGIGDACETEEDEIKKETVVDTNIDSDLPKDDTKKEAEDSIAKNVDAESILDDTDDDGIPNKDDNCIFVANPEQTDSNGNGFGDLCDSGDDDKDGMPNEVDNCPKTINPNQEDLDKDGIGDGCDDDLDNDGVKNVDDNAPTIANKDQKDSDGDGIGDAEDNDSDGDYVPDVNDNCPKVSNNDQGDEDSDDVGNACDNCIVTWNPDQKDTNLNGQGEACENDPDGDGISSFGPVKDNCPLISNVDQKNTDSDLLGDACDLDDDNDGVADKIDNCPLIKNADQKPCNTEQQPKELIADLTLDETSPKNGEINTPIGTPIMLTFSSNLDPKSFSQETVIIKNVDQKVIDGKWSVINNKATFVPLEPWLNNRNYTVTISSGVTSNENHSLKSPVIFTFLTEPDTVPPFVVSSSMENGATNISIKGNISFKLSEGIKENLIGNGLEFNFSAYDNTFDKKITTLYNKETHVIKLSFEHLFYDREYEVKLTGDINDLEGNPLKEEFVVKFRTEKDPTPLTVISVSPSPQQIIPQSQYDITSIDVIFNDDIIESTITPATFTVTSKNGSELDGMITSFVYKVSFKPTDPLKNDEIYTVRLKPGIMDQFGSSLSEDYVWSFKTETPPKVISIKPTEIKDDGRISIMSNFIITFSEPVKSTYVQLFDPDNKVLIDKVIPLNETQYKFDNQNALAFDSKYYIKIYAAMTQDLEDNYLGGTYLEKDYESEIFTTEIALDADGDGVPDYLDNCIIISNNEQQDADGDKKGDACDEDDDGDGILDVNDNCPVEYNAEQYDNDKDGVGDKCDDDDDNDTLGDKNDNCPYESNIDQKDTNADGEGDACDKDIDGDGITNEFNNDNCQIIKNSGQEDIDGDKIGDVCDDDDDNDNRNDDIDNCPTTPNSDQKDTDGDKKGDVCDNDNDGDGILDSNDNCPLIKNQKQENKDNDLLGDVCDGFNDVDFDNDGILDTKDNCKHVTNPKQEDKDADGVGDACDDTNSKDYDEDGVLNENDNCPLKGGHNPDQKDTDSDKLGDVCDSDDDNDKILDVADNCPTTWNWDQKNNDVDQFGDECDEDDDNDGIKDPLDNCPFKSNSDQKNADKDSLGDACDDTPNGPDTDKDGLLDISDNCPNNSNADQKDTDLDKIGDACDLDDDNDGKTDSADNCPLVKNKDQADADSDKIGDACDNCKNKSNYSQIDTDKDGKGDLCDNCPNVSNTNQWDLDLDGIGNLCDNCTNKPNANQLDTDKDGQGDVCDITPNGPDTDLDGTTDDKDNCPKQANKDQKDSDKDGVGNICDNCPANANPNQADSNGNGIGDVCDTIGDMDGDGKSNELDNCPETSNADQKDTDNDGLGDVCDTTPKGPDTDEDSVLDVEDNCPYVKNPSQDPTACETFTSVITIAGQTGGPGHASGVGNDSRLTAPEAFAKDGNTIYIGDEKYIYKGNLTTEGLMQIEIWKILKSYEHVIAMKVVNGKLYTLCRDFDSTTGKPLDQGRLYEGTTFDAKSVVYNFYTIYQQPAGMTFVGNILYIAANNGKQIITINTDNSTSDPKLFAQNSAAWNVTSIDYSPATKKFYLTDPYKDDFTGRIWVIDNTGKSAPYIINSQINNPMHISISGYNAIIVNADDNSVVSYGLDNEKFTVLAKGGETGVDGILYDQSSFKDIVKFAKPRASLVIDHSEFYLADDTTIRHRKDNLLKTVAGEFVHKGTVASSGSQSTFNELSQIAVTPNGNDVYVVDKICTTTKICHQILRKATVVVKNGIVAVQLTISTTDLKVNNQAINVTDLALQPSGSDGSYNIYIVDDKGNLYYASDALNKVTQITLSHTLGKKIAFNKAGQLASLKHINNSSPYDSLIIVNKPNPMVTSNPTSMKYSLVDLDNIITKVQDSTTIGNYFYPELDLNLGYKMEEALTFDSLSNNFAFAAKRSDYEIYSYDMGSQQASLISSDYELKDFIGSMIMADGIPFVLDISGNKITRCSTDSNTSSYTIVSGSSDQIARDGEGVLGGWNKPVDMAYDPVHKRIFVIDQAENVIRMVE